MPPASTIDPRMFISSLHGRQRRRERGLDRRDLENAIKNGERELQPPPKGKEHLEPRWKFTWEDVVYITNLAKTREVTSWAVPLPLEPVPLSAGEERQCKEMKRRLRDGTARLTSHTVIVVDQSGSMMKSDMKGHRNRSSCVFYNIAMEVVAAALSANIVSLTDVVTIVQMRETATVIIDAEPQSWVLFNKLVALHKQAEMDAKPACHRHSPERRAHGDGMFIPALQMAADILRRTVEKFGVRIALYNFFLSDGRPSDHNSLRCSMAQQVFPGELVLLSVQQFSYVLLIVCMYVCVCGSLSASSGKYSHW